MNTRMCPVCRVQSTEDHRGDRHLPACRHFGNDDWQLLVKPISPTPTSVNHPVTEPGPAVTPMHPGNAAGNTCDRCGKPSGPRRYCSKACKQAAYRQRNLHQTA